MLNWFHRKPDATIAALYGAIVAQARASGFYAVLGVPDTVEGRFDMIVLHLALVMRRLRSVPSAPPRAAQLAIQDLFDHFCRDMDHNLREMGVSDLGVPRRMRKFGEAFYGRAAAYDRALDAGDAAALAAALKRNVFGRPAEADDAPALRLAAYVQQSEAALAQQSTAEILAGGVRFAAVPAAETPA